MYGFRTTVRRALDRARRLGPPLGLAAFLLLTSTGVSAPVQASTPPRESVQLQGTSGRLQIVLNSIQVANDRDGTWTGDGDMSLSAAIYRCGAGPEPCSAEGLPAQRVVRWISRFDLGTGKAKNFNHVLPSPGDDVDGRSATVQGGLVVEPGKSFVFQVSMFERDVSGGDFMGGIQRILDESNGWGIGYYENEAAGHFPDRSLPTYDGVYDGLCAGCGSVIVGDYLVTYEIRRMSLPDLRPISIRPTTPGSGDPATGSETVCLGVVNDGGEASGPFDLSLYVNKSQPAGGNAGVDNLGPGETREVCINTFLPKTGEHDMRLVVDQFARVPETNEDNNGFDQKLIRMAAAPAPAGKPAGTAPGTGSATENSTDAKTGLPAPAPSPEPASANGQGKADLTVTAIRVRGQVPDGKDDCKDGGNDVSVIVKNTGKANAESFAVRLTVDGDDGDEKTVNGLEAGKEREIKFDDIRLKKGEHKLTAAVDANETIVEASEENNERTVSASCKDN